MKNVTLTLVLFLTAVYAHSQPGTLTGIQVSQRTDGSGFVDIYFNLSGSAAAYNMSLEASFDAGSSYQPVPAAHLSGDVTSVSPGNNKHLVWDGFASFPNEYSVQSKLKILATAITGGGIPGQGVTDIDGNFYPSVIIGNQEWMAENLRVTRDASGNNITRYCYGNNTANCELYGGLYTWHTVMNGQSSSSGNPSGVQGICPTGWHVPSDAEWTQLVNYLMDEYDYHNDWENDDIMGVGNALKSCRQVGSPLGGDCDTSEHPRWNSHGTHYGFDEFGFSALPGGNRYPVGVFGNLGTFSYWWSSTVYSFSEAWTRCILSVYGSVHRGTHGYRTSGYSLRCVRD
jgi:uncharacterized protein (TIGR02145 family)